jgi:hypothetical protein
VLEDKIRLLHEKYSSERPAPRERDLEMGESYRSVNTARTWGEHSARSGYNDQVVRLSARGDEGLASSRRLQESLRGSTARSGYLPLTQRSEYDDGAHVFGETHGRGKVDAAVRGGVPRLDLQGIGAHHPREQKILMDLQVPGSFHSRSQQTRACARTRHMPSIRSTVTVAALPPPTTSH